MVLRNNSLQIDIWLHISLFPVIIMQFTYSISLNCDIKH